MAAAGADPSGYAPRTESGVQVDSSVAHQVAASIKAATWLYFRLSMGVGGHHWLAFDALETP
ncbi:hypothetical protein GA0070607_4112 [Micromonospora coriariae]|uniref:Uncharacterized protein n=1 Tax=Micromonospora coriariae TaxID=285665 RepID=A0A1C4WT87_9ACTN|nr:hypothetical protein GA0070607_4112 [Micromonospora coriariae]